MLNGRKMKQMTIDEITEKIIESKNNDIKNGKGD